MMRPGAGPASITAQQRDVNVKIVGVNQTARTVTVQMPNGSTTTLRVPSEWRNWNTIKKGDTVRATIVDSMAVWVQKSAGRHTVPEMRTVTIQSRAGRPGMVVNTMKMTGRVQSVDMQNRTITVTGPGARSRTFRVHSGVDLRNIKTGDDIVMRHTEAMALNLQKTTR